MAKKSVAQRIAETQLEGALEAEGLLEQIVTEGRKPTVSELEFFQSLGWTLRAERDKVWIVQALERVAAKLNKRMIAGTAEQRAALLAEAEKADLEAQKIPELEAQRDEIDKRIASIRTTQNNTHRRCDEAIAALHQLGELIPPLVKKQVDAELYELGESPLAQRIAELRNRQQTITTVLEMVAGSKPMLNHCLGLAVSDHPAGLYGGSVNAAAWDAYVEQSRKELPGVRVELAESEEVYEQQRLEILNKLEVYK